MPSEPKLFDMAFAGTIMVISLGLITAGILYGLPL
jgi:hypothetical protein